VQKSTFGGVLSIVAGAFALVGAVVMFYLVNISPSLYETSNLGFALAMWGFLGFMGLLIGMLSIIGGIFALQRRVWGLALAGAVISLFAFLPLGIGAIILIAKAQPEFSRPKQDS
jgi:hypothetical protein